MESTLRWAVAIAVPAWLLLFAVRFADQRLYADSGYYLMHALNDGAFRIEHGRWALVLPQLLPVIGAQMGLSLGTLIVIHSVANVLWLIGCMAFAWRALRCAEAVVALAAVHLIGLAHGLFCPIFELYYGADLLILFIATWRAEHLSRRVRTALLIVLFLAVISCHLMGLALMAWALLMERAWRDRRLFVALAVIGGAYLILHALTISFYEKDHLAGLKRAVQPGVLHGLLQSDFLRSWIRHAWTHYPDTLLLALATVATFFVQGRKWPGFLVICFLTALAVVVEVKWPGFVHDRYREQVDFPASAAVLIALLLYLGASNRLRIFLIGSVAAAIGFRMLRAEQVAPYYIARTSVIMGFVAEARAQGSTKALVPAGTGFAPGGHHVELGWSVPVESLLLSSKKGASGTVSIITTEDLAFEDVAQHLDGLVFRRWDVVPEDWLNKRWFTAPTGRYEPLMPATLR